MSDDLERILRNSLDAVDRGKRWATLGVAALFAATLILLLAAFFHAGGLGNRDTSKFMFVVAAAEMLFVGCCTAAVMFHITRMTKAVLRTIESTRKG
jgi:hypothetical protein